MINPFRKRADEFPGRLFNRIDDPQERAVFDELLSGEIYLELGSGSGKHLIAQAGKRTEAKFFGLELRYKRSVRTIEKSKGAQNLFVLRAHAHRVSEFFPPGSLSGVWVNFPDPWVKRIKNRILRPRTLLEVIELLKPGAFFSFKTDHTELFDLIHGQLLNHPQVLIERAVREVLRLTSIYPENVETEFEQLFLSKGIPVSHLMARRRHS